MSITKKLLEWRIWIQSAFLLLWLDPLAFRLHGVCVPVFHCYSCPLATFACPIGILAGFSALHVFPFVAIGMLFLAGTIFGTFICGWACPFGFLQDLVSKTPTPKIKLPEWTGRIRYILLLVSVIAVPFLFGNDHVLYICRICPAGALEGAVPNVINLAASGQEIVWPSMVKILILIFFLIAIFFKHRPWCTVFCPLGAILGIFNKFSIFFLRFDGKACTDCCRCHELCQVSSQPEKSVNSSACVRCMECTDCKQDAIEIGHIFEKPKTTTPAETD